MASNAAAPKQDQGGGAKSSNASEEKRNGGIWITPTGASLLVLMLSVLAYFIGVVRLDVYLGLYGVDWKMFPLDKPDYIYVGAVTVMDSILISLATINQTWAALGAAMSLGLVISLVIVVSERLKERRLRAARNRKGTKPWHRDLAFMSITTLGMPAVLFFPVLLLAFPLVLPETIGEAVARREFAKEKLVIAKGCREALQMPRCFELVESGKTVATGFLLHATKERVLIHDGAGAAVWSLDKRELVPLRPEVGARQE